MFEYKNNYIFDIFYVTDKRKKTLIQLSGSFDAFDFLKTKQQFQVHILYRVIKQHFKGQLYVKCNSTTQFYDIYRLIVYYWNIKKSHNGVTITFDFDAFFKIAVNNLFIDELIISTVIKNMLQKSKE